MPAAPEFPIFTKVEHRPNAGAAASFSAEVDKLLASPRRKIEEFSEGARKALDTALSLPRSQTGSLDLGLPQLREAVTVQQARATAAREVANATLEAARATGTFNQQTRLEISAARALAAEEERAALALRARANAADQVQAVLNRQVSATNVVVDATRRGTDANHLAANSAKSLRFASIQAGQQVQDLAISLYSGQRASVVFAQQLPQLAFVLTGLEGSTNRTAATIGRFASFLSRPSGFLVIGAASLAIGFLTEKLLGAGKEAEKTGSAIDRLTNRLDLSKNSYSTLISVVEEYNQAQSKSTALTYDAIIAAEKEALAQLNLAKARLASFQSIPRYAGQETANRAGIEAGQLEVLRGQIKELEGQLGVAGVAAGTERVKRATDPRYAIEVDFGVKLVRLEEKRLKSAITQVDYERERLRLINAQTKALEAFDAAQKAARPGRKPRDPGELTSFISPVTGGRITSAFGEQRGNTRHPGLDIGVPVGTPVKAPAGGVVIEAGTLGGYGNVVFIDHGGGTITRLAHLSKIGTAVGRSVAQGEVIGLSGGARGAAGSGNSSGPHLHQETRVGGRAVNPLTGRFPTDGLDVADRAQEALEKSAEAVAKAREEVTAFGKSSAEAIAQTNAQFDDQPRLVDASAAAVRRLKKISEELNDTLADTVLTEEQRAVLEQNYRDAIAATAKAQSAVDTDIGRQIADQRIGLEIQTLAVTGREKEAAVLDALTRAQDRYGELTALQKGRIEANTAALFDQNEALQRAQEIQGAYLDATRSIRSEIEGLLSGQKPDFKRIFKQLQGKILFEQLFGDTFRKLEKSILRETGVEQSVDRLVKGNTTAGDSALALARDFADAGRILRGEASGGSTLGAGSAASRAGLGDIFDGVVASLGGFGGGIAGRGATTANDNEIVVTGIRLPKDTVAGMAPDRFRNLQIEAFSASAPGKALDSILGGLSKVVGGAGIGYATGGYAGGVIGALKGIKGLPEAVDKLFKSSDVLGKAADGAATGTAVAGIAKNIFGIKKFSTTGAQIGGAVGGAVAGPAGELVGSVLGGTIGGLLKKAKTGSATLSIGADGVQVGSTGGNSAGRRKAASGAGDSVSDAINRIAEQLGGTADGPISVSIGIRDKSFRVDPTGSGKTKKKNGAIDFGDDQEAALKFAILDALKDGVIQGISAGAQRLIQSGKDLDRQLQKALDFESVFTRLRQRTDPVGAAVDALDKEFGRLRAIAIEAGEGLVEVEKLYGLERADAIKQASEAFSGSLRSLIDDLTIGNDALSLRDRRAFAEAKFSPLDARVKAGDSTAFEEYATAARALLDIERQLSGSQDGYQALREAITATSQAQLDRNAALADAAIGRDSPFSTSSVPSTDNQGVIDAIGTSNATLTAINDNLRTLILQGGAGGGSATIDLGVLGLTQRGFF